MNSFMDMVGGRKFAVALLALALGTIIELVKPAGLGEAYVMLLIGIVGVFSGANALVSWKGLTVGKQPTEPPAPAPEPPPAVDTSAIDELKREQAVQAEAIDKITSLLGQILQRPQQ